jgi:hypothetical protein
MSLSITKDSIVEYNVDYNIYTNPVKLRYFHIDLNFSYIISKEYHYKWMTIRQIKRGKFSRVEKKWIKYRMFTQQKSLMKIKNTIKLHSSLKSTTSPPIPSVPIPSVPSFPYIPFIHINSVPITSVQYDIITMSVIDFLELEKHNDEKFEKTYFYPIVESVVNYIII